MSGVFFRVGGGLDLAGVLNGQLNALLSQLLKLLAAFHRFAQLLGAWPSDSFGVVLSLLPHLILVIGPEGMVGVGSRPVLGLEGAEFHLVDLGHFLQDYLPLLNEFAHERSIV
jgi:hypothetical protein